jgi:hypothetical protein
MNREALSNPDIKKQAKGSAGIHAGHDIPATKRSLRTPTHGGRIPLLQRKPVQAGRQNVSFSGRGFIPDYMTENGPTMFPEASRTTLEIEGVYGKDGMQPPAGRLGKLQAGQKFDEGSGGAGSFATFAAWGARSSS